MAHKKSKHKPQLKIVFDTNVIFNGSSSELLKEEVGLIITDNSKHKDLDIKWYLPHVVVLERQYQMMKKGYELLPSIEKLERLLGHNLAITSDVIETRVKEAIDKQIDKFLLNILQLDVSKVSWEELILSSASRRPPFDPGEKEKGFRDSIILETFLQLVDNSPTTPKICRVVLVTNVGLLSDSAKERTNNRTNIRILTSLEELKSLINTLVAEIDEEFVKKIQLKAGDLFFIEKNKETLYFTWDVRNSISKNFSEKLKEVPPNADEREDGTWFISKPRFIKKDRQRVTWASRISIETKAIKTAVLSALSLLNNIFDKKASSTPDTIESLLAHASAKEPTSDKVIAKGKTIFDIIWSVSVSTTEKFSKPKMESIEFIENIWE